MNSIKFFREADNSFLAVGPIVTRGNQKMDTRHALDFKFNETDIYYAHLEVDRTYNPRHRRVAADSLPEWVRNFVRDQLTPDFA